MTATDLSQTASAPIANPIESAAVQATQRRVVNVLAGAQVLGGVGVATGDRCTPPFPAPPAAHTPAPHTPAHVVPSGHPNPFVTDGKPHATHPDKRDYARKEGTTNRSPSPPGTKI